MAAATALAMPSAFARASAPQVHILKSPHCGRRCACVEHMRIADSAVTVQDADPRALDAAKLAAGITPETASRNMAWIEGCVIEGHMPAEDVRRLLDERPGSIGLAVPGTPIGSPEGRNEPCAVLLLHQDGRRKVVARR